MNDTGNEGDAASRKRLRTGRRSTASETCGIVCFGVGAIVTASVFQRIWGSNFDSLGFGVGGGVCAAAGLMLGAWLFREPPPIFRAVMFFVVLSGTGACLTIGKLTSWAPLAWLGFVVWAIAVLAVSWRFRRHVRSGGRGELVRNEKGQHHAPSG